MANNARGVGDGVDPTKNVLDLVEAERKRQDDLRDAETRRINDLAAMRVHYEGIIAGMRLQYGRTIEGMRYNSFKLLAEQLKENKADFSERTSNLEQFRWESGGRGTGINAVIGWVISVIMAGIAIAALYFGKGT